MTIMGMGNFISMKLIFFAMLIVRGTVLINTECFYG